MDFQRNGIALGLRLDGRRLDEHPRLTLTPNVSSNSHGSCQVCLDDSVVVTTVNVFIDKPSEKTPNEGAVDVAIETPVTAENAEGSQEKDLLYETLLETLQLQTLKFDRTKLCILESQFVWHLKLHTAVLKRGGCLLDAVSIGIVSALRTLKVPSVELMVRDDLQSAKLASNLKAKLAPGYNTTLDEIFRLLPVCTTVAKIGEKHVWGATLHEEACSDGFLSMAVDPDGQCVGIRTLGSCFSLPSVISVTGKCRDIAMGYHAVINETLANV